MSEGPKQIPDGEVEGILKYSHIPKQAYEDAPEGLLDSADSIVNAIGIGWISNYGVERQEDGKYTMAFVDENNEDCYKKEGFTEAEMLQISHTEYKGIAYKEMDERS